MSPGKPKHPSLRQELCRDLRTLKTLDGKQKLIFLWDYYRWRILACICTAIAAFTFISILWEGQKPCRLRICVALDTEEDCSPWFSSFTEKLQSDGKPGSVDVNLDQPFDYDSPYYQVHEMEVMAAISSGRMDAVVCGEDLYRYLLALNACYPLDQCLPEDLLETLSSSGKLKTDTAGLPAKQNGSPTVQEGSSGYYAVDLSGTRFFELYGKTSREDESFYGVIISNTEHLEDCQALFRALTES